MDANYRPVMQRGGAMRSYTRFGALSTRPGPPPFAGLRQTNPDAHVVQKSPIVGHVYDDLSSSVALFHIGDCFRHFDERNCPVDDRAHLAPIN